ncbi:hypothetical protein OR571_16875 [Psychrobacillus sp. NEAU-3TGS]|uniref:hypothetical protein n=1 Tax=Psychrobacillus sp. NEAU-3TGS TaxID=2995412 RepID=UPI002497E66B|nr:hypothetical protein [Psychrobacillus sp. NEAU-3TGS]MDI2588729.1 hypothetical protein [Psychrobacillus sp. NEAU-3TGS]
MDVALLVPVIPHRLLIASHTMWVTQTLQTLFYFATSFAQEQHDVAYLVWDQDHFIGRMPAIDLPLIFSFFFYLEVGVLLPVNANNAPYTKG